MRRLARLLAAAALGITPALATAGDVAVAWLAGATLKTHGSVPSQAPLGSLWKLFVYAYAAHQPLEAPPYRCGVAAMTGEEFCCEPGATVTLDTALARSCGPAFVPRRLGIDAAMWREFWSARMGQPPRGSPTWIVWGPAPKRRWWKSCRPWQPFRPRPGRRRCGRCCPS
jgi:uncharacterized protein YfaQ (DUF2300 family)